MSALFILCHLLIISFPPCVALAPLPTPTETRALRRALSKEDASRKTLRQKKADSLYPRRLSIVVKA